MSDDGPDELRSVLCPPPSALHTLHVGLLELAQTDADYADMCLKFVEHFLWIASSMTHVGGETGMWDEEDGFFYDVLRLPDGKAHRLKVRSIHGLLYSGDFRENSFFMV